MMRSVWRYLGSTRNLIGCLGGLLGVLLHLAGVVGSYWLLVVAALYAAGALIAPPERVRLVPTDPTTEATRLRADLGTLLAQVDSQAGRMPDPAVERVRRIGTVLTDMLGRPAELAADPDTLHGIIRLARTDLPLSVQTYLNLPHWFTLTRKVSGHATPAEELLTQLTLLESEADTLAAAFYSTDLKHQSDHTRYLRDRPRPADPS